MRAIFLLFLLFCPFAHAQNGVQIQRGIKYSRPQKVSLVFDLLRPTKLPTKRLPVVLFFGGGLWKTPSLKANFACHQLVRRGFAVAIVGFRGATTAQFPAALDDARSLVRFLKTRARSYSLDAEKMGVYGVSTGGTLAALLGFTSSIRGAVVLESAPSDIINLNVGSRVKWDGILSQFFGAKSGFERVSPLFWADENAPPTLLLHGDSDDFVAPSQSEKLFRKLEESGVRVRYLVFEGETHGLKAARKDADEAVVKFFVETLGSR